MRRMRARSGRHCRDCIAPAQRAQQHRLQQREIGTIADAVDQLRIIHRRRFVAARKRQRRAAAGIRAARRASPAAGPLDPVQRRLLVLREERRRADVRRQHAFLDQLVRIVARRRNDPHDLALRVEFQRQLHRVEVDRAAPLARWRTAPCRVRAACDRCGSSDRCGLCLRLGGIGQPMRTPACT